MMQLGTPLNHLIRERAYLTGSLGEAKERLVALKQDIAALRKRIALGEEQLEALDHQILALSVIPLDDIRTIRAKPRLSAAPHGRVMAGVIRFFQQSASRPVRVDELHRLVATLSGYRVGIEVTQRQVTDRTKDICGRLKGRGLLERLENSMNPDTGITYGVWRWIGPTPENCAQSGD